MKAWHFLQESGDLQWPCGDAERPKIGQTLTVDPDSLELCKYGLHASIRIIDALQYAPGPIICRVDMGGRIIKGEDKLVASERTIIAMADASEVLHRMACWAARRALKLVKNPDPRLISAIEAKEKWLKGEITYKELAAAWAGARDAAWAAAWAGARDAAWAAARDAAWDAARAAAWDAARDAARDAERKAQSRKLTTLCNKLIESAGS